MKSYDSGKDDTVGVGGILNGLGPKLNPPPNYYSLLGIVCKSTTGGEFKKSSVCGYY
jgi:hypothetical protein